MKLFFRSFPYATFLISILCMALGLAVIIWPDDSYEDVLLEKMYSNETFSRLSGQLALIGETGIVNVEAAEEAEDMPVVTENGENT